MGLPGPMELWATGFNAWGNLAFLDQPQERGEDYEDLPRFTRILSDDTIEVKALHMASTIVATSNGLKIAGHPASIAGENALPPNAEPAVAASVGTAMATIISGYITQREVLYSVPYGEMETPTEAYICENLNGPVIDVVANSTSFTALTAAGTVYTWGDEIVTDRLGREVTSKNRAGLPCVVEDLQLLPDKVIKISSGGSLSAALTSNNDIYIWGGGKAAGHPSGLWSPTPYPLDLHNLDFLDVAVGNNHVIVLTTNHKLFVIGGNGSGQLGLDDTSDHLDWTEITLPLEKGQKVTKVYAGHNNSLLLVERLQNATNPSGDEEMADQ